MKTVSTALFFIVVLFFLVRTPLLWIVEATSGKVNQHLTKPVEQKIACTYKVQGKCPRT